MTVGSTTTRWEFTGDDSTTQFPVNNKVFAVGDLVIYVDDDLQVIDTDYTVSLNADQDSSPGATVTFTEAPDNDTDVVIIRSTTNTQTIDYPLGGPFQSAVTEGGFDRRTLVAQELATRILRALRFPDYEVDAPSAVLPTLEERALKFLAFNSLGEPIASDGGIDPSLPVSEFVETLLDDADEQEFLTTLGFSAYMVNWPTAANATEALSYLGVSAFVQTLLNDTDKGVFRETADIGNNVSLLINGGFQVAQMGAGPFTSATTPANNDDTYLIDGWIILSDGNDIVDVSQIATGTGMVSLTSLQLDIETANKKAAILSIASSSDIREAIAKGACSLQFKVERINGSSIGAVKGHILGWTGTADSPTSDVVSAWGAAGVNFTPVASWSILGTVDVVVTDDVQTVQLENATVTSSHTNLAVLIVLDDTVMTIGDMIRFSDIQLEAGPVCTPYTFVPNAHALTRCRHFFRRLGATADRSFGSGVDTATTVAQVHVPLDPPMRIAPTVSFSSAAHFTIQDGGALDPGHNVTAFPSIVGANPDSVTIQATVGGGTLTTGFGAILRDDGGGNAYIHLDARL